MTHHETGQLLVILTSAYPKDFRLNEASGDVWYDGLQDYPFPLVKVAVKKHILQSKWPPTVAELRDQIAMIQHQELTRDAADAWRLVMQAIRTFGYMQREQGLASLPALVRDTVEAIGWRALCNATNIEVVRGQFTKFYQSHQRMSQQEAVLPAAFRQQLQTFTQQAFPEEVQ